LLQACDNEKNTPLHLAARANNEEIFKCLIESGRNLKNSNSNEGKKNDMYGITEPLNRNERTPLLECAKYNRKSFIEELLPTKDNSRKWKKTLDQLRDEDRMTCLHLACNQGKHETYS
jgi:ankyrin repeat protein